MAPVDLTDDQIKTLILNYMVRRRLWNKKYGNRQKIVRYLGIDVLGDGKEVSRCLDELVKARWITPYKKGEAIRLNIAYKKEITRHIQEYKSNDL